jgi:oxygen-independent coproporphyrinogen-3 oxidase
MTTHPPLALYIHWPFCISKCPYCDFNSHVRTGVNHEEWQRALLADMAYEAELLPNRSVGSIFFGGGTPSLMEPATVEALIASAASHWGLTSNVEITLEANPSSVEASKFQALAEAGVNRVSIGLQSLDDDALRFLGRAHSVKEALAAIDTAQNHFSRVSIDLIYARPDQSTEDWANELDRALALGTGHISLYQLTIEPGTRFETMVREGEFAPLDPDQAAELFEITQEKTRAAGLLRYETSNHARPGEESRHNLTYWHYGDYAGIGPGAHGRRGTLATVRHRKPENWLNAMARNGHGMTQEDALTSAERAREALVMGLRLTTGVDLADIAQRTGVEEHDLIDGKARNTLIKYGLIRCDGSRIIVTETGTLLLDRILVELVSI